jgi:hypothetical protein
MVGGHIEELYALSCWSFGRMVEIVAKLGRA